MTKIEYSPFIYDLLEKVNKPLLIEKVKNLSLVHFKDDRSPADIVAQHPLLPFQDQIIRVFIEFGVISLLFEVTFVRENVDILMESWNKLFKGKDNKIRISRSNLITNEEKADIEQLISKIDYKAFNQTLQDELSIAPYREESCAEMPVPTSAMITSDEDRKYITCFVAEDATF